MESDVLSRQLQAQVPRPHRDMRKQGERAECTRARTRDSSSLRHATIARVGAWAYSAYSGYTAAPATVAHLRNVY